MPCKLAGKVGRIFQLPGGTACREDRIGVSVCRARNSHKSKANKAIKVQHDPEAVGIKQAFPARPSVHTCTYIHTSTRPNNTTAERSREAINPDRLLAYSSSCC